MSGQSHLPMRVIERVSVEETTNVLQAQLGSEWIDLESETVPEWAIIQQVTLGSTEWRSKFANWIGK
jgi:hypothetical protein